MDNPHLFDSALYSPVTKVGRDHVEETEGPCEDELCEDHAASEQGPGPSQRQEGHQMHPLVLSLLYYQGVDPAVVSLHPEK